MELRKPLQISVVLLALNTLPTEVLQKQSEQENNCQMRVHQRWEEVE
jgi:hypothetical protein